MGTFIQIILLLFIAGFLVMQSKGGLGGLLGRKRRIILDSCALIDGRIVELVKNGFVADQLVIPQFVLNELQLLADGSDSHKRERARFGLDIAHELQDTAFQANVIIERTAFPEIPKTDDKLIQLAKKMEAYLYTTDYNLAKVAAIEAVGVLNVNELSQAIRPIALPGETLKIKIVQKGSNPNQGVGYLDDGTMIVVEGAARYAGKIVDVTVTRMHQTVAGKMVFGQIANQNREQQPRQQAPQQPAEKQRLQERIRQQPAQQTIAPPKAKPVPLAAAHAAKAQSVAPQQSKAMLRLRRLKTTDDASTPAPKQNSGSSRQRRSPRLMQ
jgi:rRNA-processing protein FCF1